MPARSQTFHSRRRAKLLGSFEPSGILSALAAVLITVSFGDPELSFDPPDAGIGGLSPR
jgi:hypothetical protein